MNKSSGVYASLALALLLLVLYGIAIVNAAAIANCMASDPACTQSEATFHDGYKLIMSTIGTLISGLVVAVLGVTQPGETPNATIFGIETKGTTGRVLQVVIVAYFIGWLALGGYATIVGLMTAYDQLPALTEFGRTWLGLAVAAVAAYLGIKPATP